MTIRKKIKASRRKTGMSLLEYRDAYGKPEAERIAKLAGTSYANYKKIAHGFGSISYDLATSLVIASGGRLALDRIRPPRLSKRILKLAA